MSLRLLTLLFLATLSASASAQRVQPYPVMPTPQFERAVANGTRSATGGPGTRYWQNRADYDIQARLDGDRLTAMGTISYTNESPDELEFLVLKLRQNVHAPGVPRNRPVALTGGVTLSRFAIGDTDYRDVSVADTPGSYGGDAEPGTYVVQGTVMTVGLEEPLAPGAATTIDLAWSFQVPPSTGSYRQGTDGEVTYLGYWYPQLAVYDDVIGWHVDPYLGMGEHYMGYGDYRLRLDMPADMLVYATGDLANADAVLSDRTRQRIAQSLQTDEIIHVGTADERGTALQPSTDGRLVWEFEATDVRDVAVSASSRYVWDATHAEVDQDGDGTPEAVRINAFYRPTGEAPWDAPWERSAEFSRFSIEHLSEMLWPYPWPHMTAVEGIITGGMEYPMMTLIGGDRTDARLFSVTYHEIGHMWFPMMVGSNEKAYTWMDEGLTSFNTNEGIAAFFDGSSENRPKIEAWDRDRQSHYLLAGTGYAVPSMRHNDRYPIGGGTGQVDAVGGRARGIASYSTPAVALHALRGLYGEEDFFTAYREYGRRWLGGHPTPYDLFNSFEDQLGQDLDWFWTPTFFSTWITNHAVGEVVMADGGVFVTVEDRGMAPMPAPVRATYSSGRVVDRRVEVSEWLSGQTEVQLRFPPGEITRIEIDPDGFILDADRSDNVWEMEVEAGE